MFEFCPVVNNRCVFDLRWCDKLPGGRDLVKHIIFEKLGLREITADPVSEARTQVGKGQYLLGADWQHAPTTVDCSLFTKWVYAQLGMQIPRASVDQRDFGDSVKPEDAQAGDLIFSTGPQNYFVRDPMSGIGHVGILTGEGTVIHAIRKRPAVEEISIEAFLSDERRPRGICRLLPPPADRLVLSLGPRHDIDYPITVLRLAQRLMPQTPILS